MAQIIRMTEQDLKNIVTESVIRILNEDMSAWQAFKKGFNGKGIAKYAVNKLYNPSSEGGNIPSNDEKEREDFEKKKKFYSEHPDGTYEDFKNSQE